MQENPFIQVLNIKIGTLIAGLLGALITMLRKSQGSFQARIIGYITAIATVLYFVPFLTWFIEWKFQVVLHSSAEHLMSFVFGMVSQTLTESFIDDPYGSFFKWSYGLKKIKRVIWNGENLNAVETNKKSENQSSEDTK